MECKIRNVLVFIFSLALTSCSYNPFTTDNHLTGSPVPTAIGAAAGVGTAALLGATKPTPLIGGGIVGGVIGYYVSTLRFVAGGVVQSGGQVFTLGDYASIEIPTDSIFDTNSSDFLEDAGPVLDSAVAIIQRYPNSNIIVSGNTSGFGTAKWEHKLAQARARQVSAYLWAHGISEFKFQSLHRRKMTYVGYGNYFPIANNIHNNSIRQNSRIQITLYPPASELEIIKRSHAFNNMGALNEPPLEMQEPPAINTSNEFSEVIHEHAGSQRSEFKDVFAEGPMKNPISPCPPRHEDYYHERGRSKEEDVWGPYKSAAG
ncbi:MAG: OmpA family protein [Gammaproteobacteria bacterium]